MLYVATPVAADHANPICAFPLVATRLVGPDTVAEGLIDKASSENAGTFTVNDVEGVLDVVVLVVNVLVVIAVEAGPYV